MIKRLTWFAGGAVAGAAASGLAARKVKRTVSHAVDQLKPANVARATAGRVREAVSEGRLAMKAKEAELRGVRDRAPAGEPIGPVVDLDARRVRVGAPQRR